MRELRKARGLTQEELAESAGITWHFISAIERGKKGAALETLLAMSATLDIALSELFLGVDRPVPRDARRLDAALAGRSPDTQKRILRIVEEALGMTR